MNDLVARIRAHLEREAAEGRLTLLAESERAWDLMVPSYWKESISASLTLSEQALRAEAFFMRAPEENAGPAYRLLLQRNGSSRLWRFSANEAGDTMLIADVPTGCVTEDLLDQLLGGLVSLTDETYRPFFTLAYETALAEQVAKGGPGLDQAPPWARDVEGPR